MHEKSETKQDSCRLLNQNNVLENLKMRHRTEESGDLCGFVCERDIHNTLVHNPLLASKSRSAQL